MSSLNQFAPNNIEAINKGTLATSPFKPIVIISIVLGAVTIITLSIAIPVINSNKKKNSGTRFHTNFEKTDEIEEENEEESEEESEEILNSTILDNIDENYTIPTEFNENFTIPSDGTIQVVGGDFEQKDSTTIVGKNGKLFDIDENGTIHGVTEDDLPLSYFFEKPITNGSSLFKDVKCFITIDISIMGFFEMVDLSKMFENSYFQEIYFGNYFDSSKIISAFEMFMNCIYLKKIIFPPSFNFGKNVRGMFMGCLKLEEVNTTSIISTQVEEMESMFEDCKSLKEISFSNDFLTGEIRSLANVFKNCNLTLLDIKYLRLFYLEDYSNIFEGALIKGILRLGKYYSNDNIRDGLFKDIAIVTDSSTIVYTPSGTEINQVFTNIYYEEKNIYISVIVIDIDYNINYREGEDYILYTNYVHVGLGWDYDYSNVYDLDSSVLTFDNYINYLRKVNFQQLTEYNGAISLNGDDLTGQGDGDDEEIRIYLNNLPSQVQIFTVQINSYKGNVLRNVKSAYIRLSTETDVIGTYSITQAGNNLGLLIGCFYKNNLNEWIFKPLNRVIPGHIVTESTSSVRQILRSIFQSRRLLAIENKGRDTI